MKLGYVYALLTSILWGLVYTFYQKLLDDVNPICILFVTSLISTIMLLPFFLINDSPLVKILDIDKRILSQLLLASIIAALANVFLYLSIQSLNATVASILEITYPLFIILFSFFMFKYVPNVYTLIGSLFIFIGVTIVIVKGS